MPKCGERAGPMIQKRSIGFTECADIIVAAGGGDRIDKWAQRANIHPLQAREYRRDVRIHAFLYSPVLLPGLITATALIILLFRRSRLIKATAIGASLSFLISTSLFVYLIMSGARGGGWGAALIVPGIIAVILALAVAVFILTFWFSNRMLRLQ